MRHKTFCNGVFSNKQWRSPSEILFDTATVTIVNSLFQAMEDDASLTVAVMGSGALKVVVSRTEFHGVPEIF